MLLFSSFFFSLVYFPIKIKQAVDVFLRFCCHLTICPTTPSTGKAMENAVEVLGSAGTGRAAAVEILGGLGGGSQRLARMALGLVME